MHTAQPTGIDGTAVTTRIHDAVRDVLSQDDAGRGPVEQCGTHPAGQLSTFELDLRDWGLVFGLVFALARSENPWESTPSVAARALEIARTVYLEWSGPIEESAKHTSDALDDLAVAYREAYEILKDEQGTWGAEEITMRLASAIECALIEAGREVPA